MAQQNNIAKINASPFAAKKKISEHKKQFVFHMDRYNPPLKC
jgi:hypothetical protein